MANLNYNQINETLDAATMALILQKIQEIYELLPKGTLTATERKRYLAMNVRNLVFVEDGVRVKNGLGNSILPAHMQNDNAETDVKLYKQVNTLHNRVKGLAHKLNDVERIVGHEAYSTVLMHYDIYKASAKVGVPNAKSMVEALEWRFKKHGSKKGNKEGPV